MPIFKGLVVGVMVSGAYWAGHTAPDEQVDYTGRTSIVVIYGDPDGDNWAELRGPGRFEALDDIMGYTE